MISQSILKIEKMYYDENKTATEIAASFGVHRTTIQNALKKNNKERYYSFRSASGKINKKNNKSTHDWEKLSLEWLVLFKKGLKLKEIAKKYGYDATHVTNIMKKYRSEEFHRAKEERKIENEKKRAEKRQDDINIEAWMKIRQEANSKEMSHRSILSDYTMLVMYIHLYQKYTDGIYRLKYNVRHNMPADMPKTFISYEERDCSKYLKRTS